jgi:hypothetical protein
MIDYHVDDARCIVVTRASGKVTIADVAGYLVRLMRDPSFRPELNALIIAGDVDAVPMTDGLSLIAPLVRAWSKRRAGVKWAFVLPDRATRDFAESALQRAQLTAVATRCFLSETAAIGWLGPGHTATEVPTPTIKDNRFAP